MSALSKDLKAKPLCMNFPLRPGYIAQIVIPVDMTKEEADRLCAFVMSLSARAAS